MTGYLVLNQEQVETETTCILIYQVVKLHVALLDTTKKSAHFGLNHKSYPKPEEDKKEQA